MLPSNTAPPPSPTTSGNHAPTSPRNSIKRRESFYKKVRPPDWYFQQWISAEYARLHIQSSPQTKTLGKSNPSNGPNSPTLLPTAPTSSTFSTSSISPPISSKARTGINATLVRTFFFQCGLTETPQQRIANDVLVLEIMKDNNTRLLTRELLELVVLKIGRQLYHGNDLTRETHTVKKMLVQNHAGIEYQPPVEEIPVQDIKTIQSHEEYQSALHEAYEYELSLKKLFAHYQHTIHDGGSSSSSGSGSSGSMVHHRHVHHHHHHFARMNESQYVAFYRAISLIPNLVEEKTCLEAFHSQHGDELGFDNFVGSMARLAIAAFSNTLDNKKQDWLKQKTGLEKVNMLIQFMNRRIGIMQEAQNNNDTADTYVNRHDLRLLKDHTLEHQHNRRILNLNASMAETLGKDQIVQGHEWLGMERSSDSGDSSSSSSDEEEEDEDNQEEEDSAEGTEDNPTRDGEGDDGKNRKKRRHSKKHKQQYKEQERKIKTKKLNQRKRIVKEKMNVTTKNLILNLMKCVKNMRKDMRTMRQERTMSLILHRWHTFVWHSKFRRMTQQGQAEHQASALAALSHCADEWKRRTMANALHVWYRWSQHLEAFNQLAARATRTRVALAYESCFVAWRDLVMVAKNENRILRNFVMRWNNLELHRWFNLWHRKVRHVVRIKAAMYRMMHAFKFRCFNYWQQYASDLQHAREMANAKGQKQIFNRLQAYLSCWQNYARETKTERDYVYIMTMRRHHRIMQHVLFTWLKNSSTNNNPYRHRSHWDDMFDKIIGIKAMDPTEHAVMVLIDKQVKRLKRKYFQKIKQSADEHLERSKVALQSSKIRHLLLRVWKLKELRYVFNGWVYVTEKFVQLGIKINQLGQRINLRLLLATFDAWKNSIEQELHNKHVLHKFILRLKNGSVNRTFNTWKENTIRAMSNRYKVKKYLMYLTNKTVVHCIRAWKSFVKDKITMRTNLEGIDRYILLERSIAAWRFLMQRKKLHQKTGRLILNNTKHRALR